jgi:hypothetical protein
MICLFTNIYKPNQTMSELEKMLRGYSPPFLQEKDGKQSGNKSGCPLQL